jgi:hypothetical protein
MEYFGGDLIIKAFKINPIAYIISVEVGQGKARFSVVNLL